MFTNSCGPTMVETTGAESNTPYIKPTWPTSVSNPRKLREGLRKEKMELNLPQCCDKESLQAKCFKTPI